MNPRRDRHASLRVALFTSVLALATAPTLVGSVQSAVRAQVDDAESGDVGALPSQLLAALALRAGHPLDADARVEAERLDALAGPLRAALADVLSSFLMFDDASRGLLLDGESARPAVIEFVTQARNEFLASVFRLQLVLEDQPSLVQPLDGTDFEFWPVYEFDLQGQDSVYNRDMILVLDLGGEDFYRNNAGGNNLRDVGPPPLGGVCPELTHAAAALIDLGSDNDVHQRFGANRNYGMNGGACRGSGFLFDAGGDDTYVAGSHGTNGGAVLGTGFLLDAGAGDDTYSAGCHGVNGQADLGAAFLIDGGGTNTVIDTC